MPKASPSLMTQQGDAFLGEESEIQSRTLDVGVGVNDIRRRSIFLRRW